MGRIADKVIKVPSKRGTDALRWILNDYETHAEEGEYFNDYYDRQGEKYYNNMLAVFPGLIKDQPFGKDYNEDLINSLKQNTGIRR